MEAFFDLALSETSANSQQLIISLVFGFMICADSLAQAASICSPGFLGICMVVRRLYLQTSSTFSPVRTGESAKSGIIKR